MMNILPILCGVLACFTIINATANEKSMALKNLAFYRKGYKNIK